MTNKAEYSYDAQGRLTDVKFPDGSKASYAYDAMGNRTTLLEVPATAPGSCCPPTVSALPKEQHGAFNNAAMIVQLSTGELVGWGANTTGVLANGLSGSTVSGIQRLLFDPNTTLPPSTASIADWAFTNAAVYVVFSNGWVYSAGANSFGELGHGDTTQRAYLKRIEYFVTNNISVTKVWASGSAFNNNGSGCVYFQSSTYSMYGCGENLSGNLGNASTPTSNISTPAPCAGVPTTPHVLDVKIVCIYNAFSTYMLFSDGTIMVAGWNGTGNLATGTTSNVTGAFVAAQKAGGGAITGIVALSATGDYYFNSSTYISAASAIALDSNGNAWSVGYNGFGQLGLGNTTSVNYFTQITTLSNIAEVKIGGGYPAMGYALTVAGSFYVWGYNGQNNLFLNNSNSPVMAPTLATNAPGPISKVFFLKSEGLSVSSVQQMIVVTTGGAICYAGGDEGQLGILVAATPGSKYIPMPRQFLDGTETVSNLFVHGSGANQRWFILSNLGNLYACGNNASSICTAGLATASSPANVEWFKFTFN